MRNILTFKRTIITENFAGDSIYEWNIDGRSDHEIFITLQRMLIAYITYSTKRATDLQAFDLLTSGFTGILKIGGKIIFKKRNVTKLELIPILKDN